MQKKQCSRCKQLLPLSSFHKSSKEKSGRRSRCKVCTSTDNREKLINNPEQVRDRNRRYRSNHPEKVKDTRDRRKEYHKAYAREWHLQSKFGLTLEQYNAMYRKQKGRCAVCNSEPTGRWKKLHVDHCHKTGKVRGLLCYSCNSAAGLVKDDAEIAIRIAAYLIGHEKDGGTTIKRATVTEIKKLLVGQIGGRKAA
jgi:hypothetical protein